TRRRILTRRMYGRVLWCHRLRSATTATSATTAAAARRETILIAWLEQMRGLLSDRVGHLLERRDVVHDVEAATVRSDDEIALLECQIVNRNERQPKAQRLPVRAIVSGVVDAAFGAGDEEA